MTLCGSEVLLVGDSFQTAGTLTDQLRRWGFRCRFAHTIRAARQLLRSVRVDGVLSETHLSEESGFNLVTCLPGCRVAAFLCLPVETSCFWLPGIDAGKECLGMPAL